MRSKDAVTGAKRCLAILALIVTLSLGALYYYVTPGTVSTLAYYALTLDDSQHKTILFWNTFFGDDDFYLNYGYFAADCPKFNNCFATHSRFLRNVEQFDAVLFHGINDELKPNDLPTKRRKEQRYVFVALESPANRYVGREFDGYFNHTMTYHLDSDVVWTYADVVDRKNGNAITVPWRMTPDRLLESNYVEDEDDDFDKKLFKLIEGKSKLAIWYRSNCETRSRRERYVHELEKHVKIDKFGRCSDDLGCPKDRDCFKSDVEPNYFFYLAFENSLCDDYVTEKFFNALDYKVVPVVYGGANYSRFAPPKSYINALDFESPKDLAKYLKSLAQKPREYKKYFDWKRRYRVISPRQRVICDLCELINVGSNNVQTISKWYSMNRCPLQKQLDKQISYGGSEYATRKTLKFHRN